MATTLQKKTCQVTQKSQTTVRLHSSNAYITVILAHMNVSG